MGVIIFMKNQRIPSELELNCTQSKGITAPMLSGWHSQSRIFNLTHYHLTWFVTKSLLQRNLNKINTVQPRLSKPKLSVPSIIWTLEPSKLIGQSTKMDVRSILLTYILVWMTRDNSIHEYCVKCKWAVSHSNVWSQMKYSINLWYLWWYTLYILRNEKCICLVVGFVIISNLLTSLHHCKFGFLFIRLSYIMLYIASFLFDKVMTVESKVHISVCMCNPN